MLCPLARRLTLKCYTCLRWKWVPVEMAMCMISSMCRNGCRTVCSPWSWDGTQMNRSSNQEVNVKVGWNTWYQIINQHLYLFFNFFTTQLCCWVAQSITWQDKLITARDSVIIQIRDRILDLIVFDAEMVTFHETAIWGQWSSCFMTDVLDPQGWIRYFDLNMDLSGGVT